MTHGIEQVTTVARSIGSHVGAGYRADAAAGKLWNTFRHQLMKYKWSRFLWKDLHLPLDQGTFGASRRLARATHGKALQQEEMSEILRQNPCAYAVDPDGYKLVQKQLWELIGELNRRREKEFKLTSRIELNLLWVDRGDD